MVCNLGLCRARTCSVVSHDCDCGRYRAEVDQAGRLPALKRGTKVWVGAEQVTAAIEAMVPRPKLLRDDAINRPEIVDRFMKLTTALIDSASEPTIWPPKWAGPRILDIQNHGRQPGFAADAQLRV